MSIRLKLLLLICSLFIAAIGNAIFTFQLETYGEEKLTWVSHTHKVLHHSELFLSSLKDTETGQRGFLLTKNPPYLQPYHTGLINAENHFQKLKYLTHDNSKQQERLITIHNLMDLKFAELAETIRLTQESSDHDEALEIVLNGKGKQYMDEIRLVLNDFRNEETILFEQRKGDFKASRSMISTLIMGELVFFILLAVMTYSFLQKSFFQPLDLLLSSTKKTEDGKPLEIFDIVQKDEMGYLLSRFFDMSTKILQRTSDLDYKAHHDKLTGLKNRVTMFDEIEQAIEYSKEYSSKCVVFFIDLNDFKILNDTLGHDAGDTILKETAKRINGIVRSNDKVFRVGGDEFIVLVKDINTVSEVQYIAGKLLKATELPVMIQGKETKISLSLGAAIAPDDTENTQELVKFADIAMYAAKRNKDTHYKFFDRKMLKRFSDTEA